MRLSFLHSTVVFCTTVILGIAQCIAQEQPASPSDIHITEVLFSQSKHWNKLNRLPVLAGSELKLIKSGLISAYREAHVGERDWEFSQTICSFMERVLGTTDFGKFYQLDVDRDGVQDVIYTGSAQCSEGNETVIWYGSPKGFVIRQPQIGPGLEVLHISPDGRSFTSVEHGCCGYPYNKYFSGSLHNPREHEHWVVTWMEFPSSTFQTPRPIRTTKKVVLRTKPDNDQEFDEEGAPILPCRKGARGKALAEKVVNGRKWFFVEMNQKSQRSDFGWFPFGSVRFGLN